MTPFGPTDRARLEEKQTRQLTEVFGQDNVRRAKPLLLELGSKRIDLQALIEVLVRYQVGPKERGPEFDKFYEDRATDLFLSDLRARRSQASLNVDHDLQRLDDCARKVLRACKRSDAAELFVSGYVPEEHLRSMGGMPSSNARRHEVDDLADMGPKKLVETLTTLLLLIKIEARVPKRFPLPPRKAARPPKRMAQQLHADLERLGVRPRRARRDLAEALGLPKGP